MDDATPILFTPLSLRGVTLPNRAVLSPMVMYHAKDGAPTDWHLVHLTKFAQGRFGLVFTEATAVEPRGRTTELDCGLWDDSQIAPFRRVVAAIHAEGSLAAVQLAHSGRKGGMQTAPEGNGPITEADLARGRTTWQSVGATADPVAPGWQVPQALSAAEIGAIVANFAAAARRADAAGFDVVEVHGAHGYLIASFLSPVSNTRSDLYGGDRAGRMRIAIEASRAVREVWPADKPVFFRVSAVDGTGHGWTLEDTVVLARALREVGVDAVDCSSGGLTASATGTPVARHPGFQVPFAAAVKRAGVVSQAVGLILDGAQAERILQDGDADLIAIGRQALIDPFWPLRAAQELGCDPGFGKFPPEYGWWLDKRARSLALDRAARARS